MLVQFCMEGPPGRQSEAPARWPEFPPSLDTLETTRSPGRALAALCLRSRCIRKAHSTSVSFTTLNPDARGHGRLRAGPTQSHGSHAGARTSPLMLLAPSDLKESLACSRHLFARAISLIDLANISMRPQEAPFGIASGLLSYKR